MPGIEEIIKELPRELQQEVEDFVLFLLRRHATKPPRKMEFSWAGALSDLGDQYASVELHHKASDWRFENASGLWKERAQ